MAKVLVQNKKPFGTPKVGPAPDDYLYVQRLGEKDPSEPSMRPIYMTAKRPSQSTINTAAAPLANPAADEEKFSLFTTEGQTLQNLKDFKVGCINFWRE